MMRLAGIIPTKKKKVGRMVKEKEIETSDVDVVLGDAEHVIDIKIHYRSYIAGPYWPEKDTIIQINRDGGVNMQRSPAKRQEALAAQIEKQGISQAEYEELLTASKKEWYTYGGNIIIPRHQIAGMLVQTIGSTPKALRGNFLKDSFRSFVQISDFATIKTKEDGIFERYVKLETSNQRSLQRSPYIEEFVATGTMKTELLFDDIKTLERILKFALKQVGCGSSRKMGFGRGVVERFNVR